MKTNQPKLWKKILISAWVLFGLGVFIFFACLASVRIEDRLDNKHWYYQTRINDSLRLDKAYPDREYVRIFNVNTNRYVSPKLRWVSLGVSEGDSLTVYCDRNGKRGFINLNTGRVVIKGRYNHAWNFSEGLAAVYRNGKIGFINMQGEEVIPCQFPTTEYAINRFGYAFHGGHATITNSKNECGLINKHGELVVDTSYDCIWSPVECGVRIFQDEDKFGVMDTDGTITLPLQYDFIYCSGNQLFAIKDGVMQHVDKYGELRECANRRRNTWFPAPRSPSSLTCGPQPSTAPTGWRSLGTQERTKWAFPAAVATPESATGNPSPSPP